MKHNADHYFAIVSNNNYTRKMLLYKVDEDEDVVTCIDYSYDDKYHSFFNLPLDKKGSDNALRVCTVNLSDQKPSLSVKKYRLEQVIGGENSYFSIEPI